MQAQAATQPRGYTPLASSRRAPNTPLAAQAISNAAQLARNSTPSGGGGSACARTTSLAVTPPAAARMAQASGETPVLLPSVGAGMLVDYNAVMSWSPMGAALGASARPLPRCLPHCVSLTVSLPVSPTASPSPSLLVRCLPTVSHVVFRTASGTVSFTAGRRGRRRRWW